MKPGLTPLVYNFMLPLPVSVKIESPQYGTALQKVQYSLESERQQYDDTLPRISGSGLVPMHLTLLRWRPLAFGALGWSSR